MQEMVRLHRLGTGAREVARLLQMSPNTERNYREALRGASLLEGDAAQLPELEVLKAAVLAARPKPELPSHQRSSLERWREEIEKLFIEQKMKPKAIFGRLRERHADCFEGTYAQVKRMCRAIGRERGVDPNEVAIVVDTEPGQVAQVDFGYIGRLYDPETKVLRKAYCFAMVLGFSRHLVARIVFDQKLTTWLRLHVECFEELGGVAAVVVPDNLKAAVVRAAFALGESPALNRSYRELARHYGFKIDPTPPFAPEKKGKVESSIRYLKGSVLAGREGENVNEVRAHLQRFLDDEAGHRVHGTTGKRPREQFEEIERASLLALPSAAFEEVIWHEATVHRDCHVNFDKRLYSVPWTLIGQDVWVRATPRTVTVYGDDCRVATHSRRGPKRRSTLEEHLPEHRREIRHRSRQYWEQKAGELGSEVRAYVTEVFESDDVLYQLRTVQAIVGLLEMYPQHRARGAARRAHFYGVMTYGGLKRILVNALDLEPLPTAVEPASGTLDEPRFARDIPELLALAGGPHEPH
ncbi:MAG: IS21 family transposase [Candidatus Heimdallarchaeota archaeon]|nr:IS21 family transposase [Candidatus Heimdallarchaeota archaeon]